MDEVSQVNTTIQKTLAQVSRCTEAETSDNYATLEDQVGDLENFAREALQAKMDFASLLPKLEQGKPLTPADLKTLELLIVGGVEYYVKYETKVEHWKGELGRVFGEIAEPLGLKLDIDELLHLRALCREAREVLAKLVFISMRKSGTASLRQPLEVQSIRMGTAFSPRSLDKCSCLRRCSQVINLSSPSSDRTDPATSCHKKKQANSPVPPAKQPCLRVSGVRLVRTGVPKVGP